MFITIDIGGTHIRVNASRDFNNPNFLTPVVIPIKNIYSDDLLEIESAIKSFSSNPEVISIACAGPIDESKSYLTHAPNLSDWIEKPIKEDLGNIFGCRVLLVNDVAASAAGELIYGNMDNDSWFLAWGTGFGGAFIKKDISLIIPSEPGHQIIIPEGRLCGCGQLGCLEAYIGGAMVYKHTGKHLKELTEEEWDEVLEFTAIGITNLSAIHKVSKVFIGGGVMINQAQRLSDLQSKVDNLLKIHNSPVINIATFGKDAGMYGALAMIKLHSL